MHGVGGYRPPVVDGSIEVRKIIHQPVHAHIDPAVEDEPQATLVGVLDQQHGGPLEVRIKHEGFGEEYNTGVEIKRHRGGTTIGM